MIIRNILCIVFLIVSITRLGFSEETSTANNRDAYEKHRIKELNHKGFNLQSKDEVKQAVFSVWNDFRKTMSSGDVNNAVNYISTDQREKYRKTLNSANQYVSKIAASLNDVENCEIESNALQVNCEMFNKVNGELRSHYIEFVRDSDGEWRIAFF